MNFIKNLEQRLKEPLPGMASQAKMFPGKSRVLPNSETLKAARKAAVCIMLFQKEDKWSTTLIKRVVYKGVHSGQMAFPGGKKEQNEDYIETAIRETEEEVGVFIKKEQVLGKLSPVYIPPSNMYVEPIIAFYPKSPIYIKQESEVDSIVEVSLDLLMNEDIRKSKPITQNNGTKIVIPHFDVNGHIVWGATAVMINELVDVLQEITDLE